MDLHVARLILFGLFVCVGTVGNILSIITVSNKHCKKSSYTVYLAGLALADLLALNTIVISYSYEETLGVNLTATSDLFCKLAMFISGLFSYVSIWLIVILALERTFVVYFPFKAKSVCKPKNAFIVTTLLVTFFIAFSSHFIYGMQIQAGMSANGADSMKPNVSSIFDRKENASLSPFPEAVSDSLHNNNNNKSEGATIDESIGRFIRKEFSTNKLPTVMGQDRDHVTTDHPGAIASKTSDTTSGNRPISSPECCGSNNETSVNQTGNCLPVGCNGDHLGDLTPATTCNSLGLKSIGNQSHAYNTSGLLDNDTTTMLPNDFKDNCTIINQIEEDSLIESRDFDTTISMPIPHNQDNDVLIIPNFCGFVDESYANFFRSWAMIDLIMYFWLPIFIISTANTATWIKVYRSSRQSLTEKAALTLRRTRHVLILTSMISIGFIVFITPMAVIYLMEVTSPLHYGDSWAAVFKLIGECLFLSNHSFNFFLYIVSGQRFRNSLKAAFYKTGISNVREL